MTSRLTPVSSSDHDLSLTIAAAIAKQPDVVDRATQTIAMKKIATPEEVAASVLFLSSPLASHTSGAIFPVTGGMEGRLLWSR